VKDTDARTIAVRLGLDETNVRRLQARGYLLSLSFDEREIRALLLRAHCAYLAAGGARSQTRGHLGAPPVLRRPAGGLGTPAETSYRQSP
jgi:hypothetical protein